MNGCLSLEEDWLYGCVVRDVLLSIVDLSSVISLCLAFFFLFLSANNGTAMHQYPQANTERLGICISPHAWNTIQDLWRSVSWNIIRILRLLVSATLKWVTFCDLISSPKLCSSTLPPFHLQFTRCRRRRREGAGLVEWASASQDADCLFVYMFGLLILSSGL